VNVNEEVVKEFVQHLRQKLTGNEAHPFDWRNPEIFLEDKRGKEDVSQFFAIGNSINFRYWLTKDERKYCEGSKGGKSFRGAEYMWRCLKTCCDDATYPILEAPALATMKISDARAIFRDDNGKTVMPMIEERVTNCRDFGCKLRDYWSGHFFNLVQETQESRSLRLFVNLSRQFRAFDDPLCKMTMVNAIMHRGRGIANFDEPIFPGMDYQLLKQQIRNGILELDSKLGTKITKGELISSVESKELRSAGLAAFLDIMRTTHMTGDVLDNTWWSNRKKCTTRNPVCKIPGKESECFFYGVCRKRTEFLIPVEETRYY
jgi:hypothetical protein